MPCRGQTKNEDCAGPEATFPKMGARLQLHLSLSCLHRISPTRSQHAKKKKADMRAFSSSRASRRHLGINPILKPHLMSRSATFASIQKELLARPPNFYQEGIRLQALRQLHASLPPLKISQADIGDHCKHYFQGSTEGCQLPQGHHIAFLNSTHPVDLLLPDGTDPDHSPGPPFTRRLWAGGSVAFSRARQPILRSKLVCRESIIDVNLKGLPPGDETSFETALGPEVKILVDVERRYGLNYDGESREICSPIIIERRTLCFMTPRTPQDITNRPGDQPVTKTIKGQSSRPLLRAPQSPLASWPPALFTSS